MGIDTSTNGLFGRRVLISGSSSPHTRHDIINAAHSLVSALAAGIIENGGGLVTGVGREPRAPDSRPGSPALTFDWTALETALSALGRGASRWPFDVGRPLVVVLSEKAESEIPADRKQLWNELLKSSFVDLKSIQPGARSGAMVRELQARYANILVTLGGGTGVEHLADRFISLRRPVIPLDLPLGASRGDGTGGSESLARLARASPGKFFRLDRSHRGNSGAYLTSTSARHNTNNPVQMAKGLISILLGLERPKAFYVRLMDRQDPAFPKVDEFFRRVVDPVTQKMGFQRVEIGTDEARCAFINVEIFESLHFSDMAVVDITGHRPNCFIELGYSLGRGVRTIVTAQRGTPLPFDQQAIPCYFWDHSTPRDRTENELSEFLSNYLNRPQVVQP
jgi:hypothetical protein